MSLFIFVVVAAFSSISYAELSVSKKSGSSSGAELSFDGEKARQIYFGLDDKMESVERSGNINRVSADKSVRCSFHREIYRCFVELPDVQFLDPNQAKAAAVEAKFEKAD